MHYLFKSILVKPFMRSFSEAVPQRGQGTDLWDILYKYDYKSAACCLVIHDMLFEGNFNDFLEGKFTYSEYFSWLCTKHTSLSSTFIQVHILLIKLPFRILHIHRHIHLMTLSKEHKCPWNFKVLVIRSFCGEVRRSFS